MAREAKKELLIQIIYALLVGFALNCVANGKIEDLGIFKRVYIQPASGDAGGSFGCSINKNQTLVKYLKNPTTIMT